MGKVIAFLDAAKRLVRSDLHAKHRAHVNAVQVYYNKLKSIQTRRDQQKGA